MVHLDHIFIKDLKVKNLTSLRDVLSTKLMEIYHTSNLEVGSVVPRGDGTEVEVSIFESTFDSDILQNGIVIDDEWYPVIKAISRHTATILALNVPRYISNKQLTDEIKLHCPTVIKSFQDYKAVFPGFTIDVGVRKIVVPHRAQLPVLLNPVGPDRIVRPVKLWCKEQHFSQDKFVAN